MKQNMMLMIFLIFAYGIAKSQDVSPLERLSQENKILRLEKAKLSKQAAEYKIKMYLNLHQKQAYWLAIESILKTLGSLQYCNNQELSLEIQRTSYELKEINDEYLENAKQALKALEHDHKKALQNLATKASKHAQEQTSPWASSVWSYWQHMKERWLYNK